MAVETGCKALLIGFESLNPAALEEANKPRLYRQEDYLRLIGVLHDNGIAVEASFVFGFDEDDTEVFERTVDFCKDNRIQVAQFSALTPFPGTRLFERLSKQGRILHHDWELYDAFHAVFKPARMSAEELQEGVGYAYRKEGAAGLTHGNRGKVSPRRVPEAVRKRILELSRSTYIDYNDCHFTEKLEEVHKIKVSRSTVRRLRRSVGQGSSRKCRPPHHRKHRERYPQRGMLL